MLCNVSLVDKGDYFHGCFTAMASSCELLMETRDTTLASKLLNLAVKETKRIEQKYSRYLSGNIMSRINNSAGKPVEIDAETHQLLTFANTCYALSEGMFDITSGVLRKIWTFDGSDNIPSISSVLPLLNKIGWQHIEFDSNSVSLPFGFELDFGGIGKEYAVDKVANVCTSVADISVLVNFGGDIQVTKPRKTARFWQVGIDDPRDKSDGIVLVNIASGGLATSGDANRFLLKKGKRYSHILNPITGYPVENAPRSVTVAGQSCVQSGLLATLAILQGGNAEKFLQEQHVNHWCFK